MRTLKYNIIIATMAAMFSFNGTSAQCTEGCTQTVTPATSTSNYTVSSGKLCIPTGVTFNGTVEILAGGTLENCGIITGSVLIQGGAVINNGTLRPMAMTYTTGELTNNGTFSYNLNLAATSAKIVNNGTMTFTNADLELLGGRLILNGDASMRNLSLGLGTKMYISGGADFRAYDFNMAGDSLRIAAGSDILIGNTLTIFNKARVYTESPITVEMNLVNDGKFVADGDLLIKNNFIVGRTGEFILADSTHAYVKKSFENLDGIFLDYGRMRIAGRFKNDGYLLMNDNAIIHTMDLTNDGILDGCGCSCNRGIAVSNLSVNTGDVLGELDFCDSTGGRFDIDFGYIAPTVTFCEAVLPVKMLSFSAEEINKAVLLKWSTASEYNNSHFEVMKSENGSEWSIIGRVEGNGTSTTVNKYEFSHMLNSSAPAIYFRLKQVDYDGKFEYSSIVVVKPGMNTKFNTMVLGNPFNDQLSLSVASKVDGRVNFELLDINGQVVLMDNVEVVSGSNTFNLSTTQVENGIYFLRIMMDGIHTETIKVMK